MSILTPKAAGFVTRQAAGLRAPRSVSHNISPETGGVAIHYGGLDVPTSSASSAAATWRSWQNYHMNSHGWVDIAYTMGVDNWGFVYAGRGQGVRTAANGTNDANNRFYAICWIGGARQKPTRAALSAIAWAVRELREADAGDAVRPHSSFKGTGCPGDDLRGEIVKIDGKPFESPEPEVEAPSTDTVSASWNGPQSIGIFRTNQWHLNDVPSGGDAYKSFYFGTTEDVPLSGRLNGKPFVAIVRGNQWYIKKSLSGGYADASFKFGREGDVFLLGDWNGDGNTTPGVFRDGEWFLKNDLMGGEADYSFFYGKAGDTPVVGDWRCQGCDSVGIVRDGEWFLKDKPSAGDADVRFRYGRADDLPIVGKWASGKSGVGIVRDGYWYLRREATAGPAESIFRYGRVDAGDTPVVGYW
ncbi:MAG: peptidoglycan recognition protein family protein [Actinobacteria bacterium]|nr:peptidoglycan recognition protein family protein [Actinomycetota bacterium]